MADVAASVQELKAPDLAYYVWLEVDGEKVEVYNVQVEGKVASGYVEAKFGAEVALGYRNEMNALPYDLCQRAYADGSYFQGRICRTDQALLSSPQGDPSRTTKLTGARISQTEEQALTFVPVGYTQEENLACHDERVLREMGTITLRLTYGKADDQPLDDAKYSTGLNEPTPLYGAAEEEEKKANRVGLGVKREAEPRLTYHFAAHDGGVSFAKFEFHYASKEILQQKGYLPANPSTPPATATNSVPRARSDKKPRLKPDPATEVLDLTPDKPTPIKRAASEDDDLVVLGGSSQVKTESAQDDELIVVGGSAAAKKRKVKAEEVLVL